MRSARHKIDVASIVLFLAVAIALSALWGYFASSRGMLSNPRTAGFAAWLAQTTVLIAAGFTMLLRSRAAFRRVGWRLGSLKAYAAVFAVTLTVVALALGIAFFLGGLSYAPQVTPMQVVVTVPILLIPSCLFAFAEEFGWRGFLLQQLESLGARRALLLSGVCWFLWELPLVVFGLLDATLIHINLPVTLVLHFLQTLSVGVALGYLRLRFGSIWLPTFAHGLLNTLGALAFFYFAEKDPFIGDFAGYIGTALLAVLAALLLVASRKGTASRMAQ
ncbi:MAG TPA: CPBP family intramembrane glutamic endopeptidase [Steroidobacteraceae bacterium]